MIPRIKSVRPIEDYKLHVVFDDGKAVVYNVNDDIVHLENYAALRSVQGLFNHVQLDASRTCVYWNDMADLPSDILYEYGKPVTG